MTDLPIIVVSIYLLNILSSTTEILGIISLMGGLFLIYIGFKNFNAKIAATGQGTNYATSIKYGILTNILSPHPYLFWITVGAPTFIKASQTDQAAGYYFIGGFYLLFFSSKIGVAILTGFFNNILTGKTYHFMLKLLALAIILFAVVMIYDGIGMIFH